MSRQTMGDPIHGDGIFQCRGCGQTYTEYVNGCARHDDGERKVVLVIPDALTEEDTAPRIECERCLTEGVVSCQPYPCEHGGHTCDECGGIGHVEDVSIKENNDE